MLRIFKLFSFFTILSILIAPFPLPAMAAGAGLFFSPATGNYAVGKTFNVSVMIDSSGGVGINSGEGTVKYDPKILAVTRVSKTNSIFSLWVAEPKFSNSKGEVSFAGGSPSAYTGKSGSVMTVTFSALAAGTAEVSFSAGMVLAADGKGTNALTSMGKGSYVISEAAAKPAVEEKPKETVKETPKPVETKPAAETKKDISKPAVEEPKGMLPPIPKIQSQTHSEEDKWYAERNADFTWKLLSDVTDVSLLLNDVKTADPGQKTEGVIDRKKIENIQDGIKYVHVKFKNAAGWGEAAHRKIMIDGTPPVPFTITIDNQGDSTNPAPYLKFKTEDKTSGIASYKIKIGATEEEIAKDRIVDGVFQISAQKPGVHDVVISVIDLAGNIQSSAVKLNIEPLRAPIITEIPKVIEKPEELRVVGESFYPNAKIIIYIGEEGKQAAEFEVQTDETGGWRYEHTNSISKGFYHVWAKLIDSRGAESNPTVKELLTVVSPSIFELYGNYIFLGLIFIIILLIIYIFYQRLQFRKEIERIKRETDEVKDKMGKVFAALREEVDDVIEFADKKPGISESEKRVKDKLREALDVSEEFLSKEIEDVEKEIK